LEECRRLGPKCFFKVRALDPLTPYSLLLFWFQSAGNAVKRATDNLVRAAQQAIDENEERSFVLNRKMVGGM